MWYIHVIDYYLEIKRNEILIQTTTWMNPENMQNERNQQNDMYYMIPLYEMPRIHKSIEQKAD